MMCILAYWNVKSIGKHDPLATKINSSDKANENKKGRMRIQRPKLGFSIS